MDTSKIAGAGREAELSRLKRELTLLEQRYQDLDDLNAELRNDNDELTRTLQSRARREGESRILIDRLNNLRQQLRDVERMRDSFKKETQELQLDLKQLREQQHLEQNRQTQEAEQLHNLQQQLEEQRSHSRQQLNALQQELDEALKNGSHDQQANNDQILELEALRQENSQYRKNLSDRIRELQTSQETGQLLEDELEDANREIDELRRQLEKQQEKLLHAQHNLSAAAANGATLRSALTEPKQFKLAIVAALSGFCLALLLSLLLSSAAVQDDKAGRSSNANTNSAQSSAGQIIRQ